MKLHGDDGSGCAAGCGEGHAHRRRSAPRPGGGLLAMFTAMVIMVIMSIAFSLNSHKTEKREAYCHDQYLQYKYMQGQGKDFPCQIVIREWQLKQLNVIDLSHGVEIVPATQNTVIVKAGARRLSLVFWKLYEPEIRAIMDQRVISG